MVITVFTRHIKLPVGRLVTHSRERKTYRVLEMREYSKTLGQITLNIKNGNIADSDETAIAKESEETAFFANGTRISASTSGAGKLWLTPAK